MGSLDGLFDTKLNEAVRAGDIDGVRVALEQGYDPNLIGVYQWSSIHEAAFNGDREILTLLLQGKGDPNTIDNQQSRTPTHYAAENGHVECLKMLVDAGARYDIEDANGKNCLDVVTPGGRKLLERLKVRELMLKSGNGDIDDKDEGILLDRSHDQTSSMSSSCTSSTISLQDKGPVLGYVHLSIEYHLAKSTLKLRIWQLSDLLLPPPSTSMIHSIYVKSYLQPDKKRETKRKTEEVKVDSSKGHIHWRKKKELSIKHVFTPSNFKFSQALEYSGITTELVKDKQLLVEVCITQRYSHRSFLIGMVRMPLRSAIKKVVKEKLPLIPCVNHTIPSSMKVYCASELDIRTNSPGGDFFFSNPNVRIVLPDDTDDVSNKAASNPDLQPQQQFSPSTEVDMNYKYKGIPNVPKLEFNNSALDESGYSSEFLISMPSELESPDSDSSKNSFNVPQEKTEPKRVKVTQVLENIQELALPNTKSKPDNKSSTSIMITNLDDNDLSEVLVENNKLLSKKAENSTKLDSKSKKKDKQSNENSSPRSDTPTWDYYDIPTEVVSQDVYQSTSPWKEGAAPVILPMNTTLGISNTKDTNTIQPIKKDRPVRRSKKKLFSPVPGKAVSLVPGKAVPLVSSKAHSLIPTILVTNPEPHIADTKTKDLKETKLALQSEKLSQINDRNNANTEGSKINYDIEKGARPKTSSVLKKIDRKLFVNVGKAVGFSLKGSERIDRKTEVDDSTIVENEQTLPKVTPRPRKLRKVKDWGSNEEKMMKNDEVGETTNVPPLRLKKVEDNEFDALKLNGKPVMTGTRSRKLLTGSSKLVTGSDKIFTGSGQISPSVVVDIDKLTISSSGAHVVELIEEDISITELADDDQLFTDRSDASMTAFTDIESGLSEYHLPEWVSPVKYMIPMQVYDVDDTSCDESIAADKSYSYSNSMPTTEL